MLASTFNWILSFAWNSVVTGTSRISRPSSFRTVYRNPSAGPASGAAAVCTRSDAITIGALVDEGVAAGVCTGGLAAGAFGGAACADATVAGGVALGAAFCGVDCGRGTGGLLTVAE